MKRLAFWIALGACAGAPLVACGGDDDDSTATGGSAGAAAGGGGGPQAGAGGSGTAGSAGASTGGTAGSAGASMGGAAGSAAGAPGASGAAGAPGGGAPSCEEYCAAIMDACSGEDAQYTNEGECRDVCAEIHVGSAGDTGGNTLGCRLTHVAEAATDPTHCSAAGPAGAGTCGDNCDAYCTFILLACPDEFGSETSCMNTCSDMTGAEQTTFSSPSMGDNLQCRIYHAALALSAGPTPHCMHASATPTAPCM